MFTHLSQIIILYHINLVPTIEEGKGSGDFGPFAWLIYPESAPLLIFPLISTLKIIDCFPFQNPSELTSAVDQNILDYSVSFGEKATLANCSSSSCSLNVQPITSLSTVSVAARNVIGRGQERSCNLSPSANSEFDHIICTCIYTC